MNLVLASNAFYLPHTAVTILSVLKTNSGHFCIRILTDSSISEKKKQEFFSIFKPYRELELAFCNVSSRFPAELSGHRLPAMTFYRILIPVLFHEWDRCLYLDTDLIVNGDLSPLYNCAMEGMPVAGVHDRYMELQVDSGAVFSTGQTAKKYCQEKKMDPHRYINGGVLLFDLKAIRESTMPVFEQMLDMTTQFFEFNDQDIFNIMLAGKILLLDSKWNYMNNLPPGEKRPEKPVIFHHKPWVGEDIPHISKLYWQYIQETPYYFRIRSEFILHAFSVSVKGAQTRYSMKESVFLLFFSLIRNFLYFAEKKGFRK